MLRSLQNIMCRKLRGKAMVTKNIIRVLSLAFSVFALPLLLGGCGSTAINRAFIEVMTGGDADNASIAIVARDRHVGERVNLYVDGALVRSDVEAVEESKATRKAERIVVAPGTHEVSVVNQGGVELFRQKVFLSAGKVKLVVLLP